MSPNSYKLNINFFNLYSTQLITTAGFSRDHFRLSNNTIRQAIWHERMEPYINDDLFKVFIVLVICSFF